MTRLLSIVLTLLMLSSCQETTTESPTSIFEGVAMTIPYRIVIDHSLSSEEKISVESLIGAVFSKIDTIYNKWNPHSELSLLNNLKAGTDTSISPELENFLHFTNTVVELSNGRFDPTIEPLQQIWKKHLSQGAIPSSEEVNSAIPSIGWELVQFGNGLFSKSADNVQLDLGGIAKGYCVDLLTTALIEGGHENFLIDWGGELKAVGQHPDKRSWRVFISHFGSTDPSKAIAIIELNNKSIATSGDYLQNWDVEINGELVTLCHVINPQTYTPLQVTTDSIGSVTVMAESCALADGLATAAMLFPSVSDACQWMETIKEVDPSIEYWIESR